MERWKNYKILIVNDDPFLLMLVTKYLSATGIQITYAMNGEEAIHLCKNNKYDIILMNIQMPIMNGFKATSEIRGFNRDIVIIAESSYHYESERFFSNGFTDFVLTPFDKTRLIQLFKKYLF